MNCNYRLLAIAAVFALVPLVVRAGALDENVIGLFPKNVTQFAYLDLEAARQQTWFAQFQQQALPPSVIALEQYLSSSGINPNKKIKEVAWATVTAENVSPGEPNLNRLGGGIVGVLLGDFDTASVQATLDARNLPTVELNGYRLYSCGIGPGCGNFYLVFLDSNTEAFGQLAPMKQLLRVKDGAAEGLLANQGMTDLIEQANGVSVFWDVFDSTGARRAAQELAPEVSKFNQSKEFLSGIKSLSISVQSSTDTELDVQIDCASPNDSLLFSQVLQAGLLLRKYQARQGKPVLAETLDDVNIAPNGNLVDVSIELSNDRLIDLIEENAFAAST